MESEVLVNMSEVISSLPPYILDRFDNLVLVLKAVGIAFIIYVVYVIVKMVLSFKSSRRLKILIKKPEVSNMNGRAAQKEKGKTKYEQYQNAINGTIEFTICQILLRLFGF